MATAPLFEEESRLTRRARGIVAALLVLGPLAIIVIFGYGLYQQLVLGRPFGSDPLSNSGLIGLSIGMLILMVSSGVVAWAVILRGRCRVVLEQRRLIIDAVPFGSRKVQLGDIRTWALRPTRRIGMRYELRGGWVINLGGTHLLTLTLKRGGPVAVGTARPEELAAALTERLGPSTTAAA